MTEASLQSRFNPKIAEALKEVTRAGGYPVLLGIEVTRCEPGVTVCTLPIKAELLNGVGTVHGGAVASLIDHTLSLTIYPLVEPGRWVATLEFKTNYLSYVKDGALVATGRVESLRRHVAVVRVQVDNQGEPVAMAQGTLYIRDKAG